jgi:hypothetical protein
MSTRRARELPRIGIGGVVYYVDLRLNELRGVDDFMNRITLDSDIYESGRHSVVLFVKVNGGVFRGSYNELKQRFGKDVIEIPVPSLKAMDPEGFEWLLDDILDESPIICQGVKDHPEVINAMVKRFAPRKENEPLLIKKRILKNKGKRL